MRRAVLVVGFLAVICLPAAAADRVETVVARASHSVVVVYAGDAQGSAFGYGRRGDYLTNAHVVQGNATATIVDDRGHRRKARVIAIDQAADVALLRSSLGAPVLRPALTTPQPGETVLTIGAASGLPGTVTRGIVSAVGRRIGDQTMIQTDAALNPGDSGGALIDESGRVIGVTTSRRIGAEGIAFAIPVRLAAAAVHTPAARSAAIHVGSQSAGPLGLPMWSWIAAVVVAAGLVGAAVSWRLLAIRVRRQVRNAAHTAATAAHTEVVTDPVVVIRRRERAAGRPESQVEPQSTEETWI